MHAFIGLHMAQVLGKMCPRRYGDTWFLFCPWVCLMVRPLSLPAASGLVPYRRAAEEQLSHDSEPKHKSGHNPVCLTGLLNVVCSFLAFPAGPDRSSPTQSLLKSLCSRMRYQIRHTYHNTSTQMPVFSREDHEEKKIR